MKRIKSLSSAALRCGCSYYGLNPVRNHHDEIVFVFRSISYCAFMSYLRSKNIPHHIGFKNNQKNPKGFFSVYVPVYLLKVHSNKKILFKNFFQFIRSFTAFISYGYETDWEVSELNKQQRQQTANTLNQTQWGKKLWYENNLMQAR